MKLFVLSALFALLNIVQPQFMLFKKKNKKPELNATSYIEQMQSLADQPTQSKSISSSFEASITHPQPQSQSISKPSQQQITNPISRSSSQMNLLQNTTQQFNSVSNKSNFQVVLFLNNTDAYQDLEELQRINQNDLVEQVDLEQAEKILRIVDYEQLEQNVVNIKQKMIENLTKVIIDLPLDGNQQKQVQFNKKECNCKNNDCKCNNDVLERFNSTQIFGDAEIPDNYKAKVIDTDYLAVSWHNTMIDGNRNQTSIYLQIMRILKDDKLVPIYKKEILATTVDDRINVESIYELYEVDNNVMLTVGQKKMKGYFFDFHQLLHSSPVYRQMQNNFRQIFMESMTDFQIEKVPAMNEQQTWNEISRQITQQEIGDKLIQIMDLADLSCQQRSGIKQQYKDSYKTSFYVYCYENSNLKFQKVDFTKNQSNQISVLYMGMMFMLFLVGLGLMLVSSALFVCYLMAVKSNQSLKLLGYELNDRLVAQ